MFLWIERRKILSIDFC